MQQYAGHPAQMQYRGGAVVSTFVGDSFNWDPVKQGTSHPIYPLPNLQDPAEASTVAAKSANGAFSWLAWPTDGGNSIIPGPMTTVWDDRFFHFLAGKTYMAREKPMQYSESHPKLTPTQLFRLGLLPTSIPKIGCSFAKTCQHCAGSKCFLFNQT
jgi:hypothetical protein